MIKYKFDVYQALNNAGMNVYKAKMTNVISQETLKKIKEGNTNINSKSLNAICAILDMQPQHILMYVPDEDSKKIIEKLK